MRQFSMFLLIVTLISSSSNFYAQTFTMGKKCLAALAEAESTLAENMPEKALTLFDEFSSKCKTKDAKERAAIGKAQAYNALELYPSAIAEADRALDVTKGKSLEGHFQKAIALNRSGDIEGSKKELEAVIELTENNENTGQRASNYAVMAAIYERQLKQLDSAEFYLNKARELDPNNVNFAIQEGDMYAGMEDYEKAYLMYDHAADMDPNSLEVYVARSEARVLQMQQKYSTDQAQALRKKMTSSEQAALCTDLKKAVSLGWNDLNKELFIALVCD